MKKKFLLAMLIAASTTTIFAQPTLTKATNNPVAGDVFYGYTVDTTGVNKGAAGANVTWALSTIVKNDSDTTSYYTCIATPYCDSFPGANIVMLNDSEYSYCVSGTNGIEVIGTYYDDLAIHMSNSSTLTRFPLSFGTTFNDTFSTEISMMGTDIYIKGYNTHTADAWGKLILPNGTFNNVLRVKTVSIMKDSVNFMGMPNVNVNQTETYNWYVSGFHSPLLTVNYDTTGGTMHVIDAKYYKYTGSTTGVKDRVAQTGALTIFPNPASEQVTIRLSNTGAAATITILDMTGQVVTSITEDQPKDGTHDVQVPIANLPNGIYMVHVQSEGATLSGRFSVVR